MDQFGQFLMDLLGKTIQESSAITELIGIYLWHEYVLYFILAVGVLFTIWTCFGQYIAMTHGVAVVSGKYDNPKDPGAINHFQALSAALSATVGIGNIGGVAGAIAVGGPGAVFWMWIVGIIGMALKMVEVSLAMLYRNTDDPDNPHGGAMWVADRGLPKLNPSLKGLGKVIGVIFCITLLISTVTGGNMFQAWNVADVTHRSFEVPRFLSGLILSLLCGLVIIGGIKSIGRVAGFLVPFMCVIYLIAGLYTLSMRIDRIPDVFSLIFQSAFGGTEARGAFIGGTFGYAFSWGMKRAFFSNEAGQGSAPIAHSAAKTDEPIREGIVAGIGPFIDTLIVCTITSLIILSSGAWDRENIPDAYLPDDFAQTFENSIQQETDPDSGEQVWKVDLPEMKIPKRQKYDWNDGEWTPNTVVFTLVVANTNTDTGQGFHKLEGNVIEKDGENKPSQFVIQWKESTFLSKPELDKKDGHYYLFIDYPSATLTSHAFDRVTPGLGSWMIPMAVWLFALSTAISWSYYGEQGIVYLFGMSWVTPYRVIYCILLVVATLGFIKTDAQLGPYTDLGTGVMLVANLPICLIFGHVTMKAYYEYLRRWRAGEFPINQKRN